MKLTPLNRPLELFGTGFPGGVVAAPVGSIYTDLDATNGAIRWIKTTGTGIYGWKVEYGDTGWRDADAYLPWLTREGTSRSRIRMRRVGDYVELDIRATYVADHTTAPMPTGFIPLMTFSWLGPLVDSATMDRLDIANLNVETVVNPYQSDQLPDGASIRGVITYPAAGDWPSVLPGLPS